MLSEGKCGSRTVWCYRARKEAERELSGSHLRKTQVLVSPWLMHAWRDGSCQLAANCYKRMAELKDQFMETGFPAPAGKGNSVQFMSGKNGHLRGKYLQIGINSILSLMPASSQGGGGVRSWRVGLGWGEDFIRLFFFHFKSQDRTGAASGWRRSSV